MRSKIWADEDTHNVVNIGILNLKYDVLNYDESNSLNPNNAFTLIGYELRYIDGKEPYTLYHTTIISPLKNKVFGSNIRFKFKSDLIFSNGKPIRTLRADLGDGITRAIIRNGILVASDVSVLFSQSKNAVQSYYITFADGSYLTTRSIISVYVPSQSGIKSEHPYTKDFTNFVSAYSFKGYDEPDSLKGVLDYRVFYAKSDKVLRKPFLILDGFDQGDKRKIEKNDYLNPNDTTKNPKPIYELMKYYKNGKERNLILDLNAKGYDVVIVNFPSNRIRKPWIPEIIDNLLPQYPWQLIFIDGGADFIERNAYTVATLIQKLNQEIQNNNSNEKLVIVGPSMGGQISRYALAWMEKNNIEHNTRIWLSFDSPHLGAHIPIGIQSALYLMAQSGIAQGSDRYNYVLKSPAAQQMLINQHKELGNHYYLDSSYMNGGVIENGFSSDCGAPFFQTFYKNQAKNGLPGSKGYPKLTERNIALVNGYSRGNILGYDEQQTLEIKGYIIYQMIHVFSLETFNQSNDTNFNVARLKKVFNNKSTLSVPYDSRGNLDCIAGGSFDSYNQIAEAFLEENNKKSSFDFWSEVIFENPFSNTTRCKPHFDVLKNKKNMVLFLP